MQLGAETEPMSYDDNIDDPPTDDAPACHECKTALAKTNVRFCQNCGVKKLQADDAPPWPHENGLEAQSDQGATTAADVQMKLFGTIPSQYDKCQRLSLVELRVKTERPQRE